MEASLTGLSLGELLDDQDLGLAPVVGAIESRERMVEGAHCIELPDPAPWLDQGWVMLTTGISLPSKAHEQRALIRQLDDRGVAALGFGVGCRYDEVPAALVEEARARSFPLFVVPKPTPFREVVAAVQQRVVGGEAQAFARLTSMQRYLTDALSEPDAEACIVGRLAALMHADVAVIDGHGVIVHGRSPLSEHGLRDLTVAAGCHAHRISEDEFAGWIMSIGTPKTPDRARLRSGARWLVAGVAAPHHPHALLKAATQLTVPLLEATARLTESGARQDRALRRATLDVLMDARTDADAALASARVHAYGVDVCEGVRVAVVTTRTVAGVDAETLLEALEDHLAAQGCPWLTTERDDSIVVLLPADAGDEETLEILLEVHPHALVGVGRRVHQAEAVSVSRRDAALVVRQLSRRGPARAASYEELDLGSALLSEIEPDRIRDKIDRWLTPVIDNPMAYETLVAYLEHDLDVGRTSRALRLHPNSARYRLARIEELLGAPLRRPSTIAALHFALLSHRYGDGGHAVGEKRLQAA